MFLEGQLSEWGSPFGAAGLLRLDEPAPGGMEFRHIPYFPGRRRCALARGWRMRRLVRAVSCGLVVLLAAGCGAEVDPLAPPTGSRAPRPVVGVILPDRSSSDRWEDQDRPLLLQALNFAG